MARRLQAVGIAAALVLAMAAGALGSATTVQATQADGGSRAESRHAAMPAIQVAAARIVEEVAVVPAGFEEVTPSPLSDAEMTAVMKWVAAHTGAVRLPFCWKQSFTRGAGQVLTSSCAPGLEKNGELCYEKCKPGFAGNGPVCWGNCPSGFNDIGAFCQKPSPYGRGSGYALWNEGKCNSENPQGCEKSAAMYYPKCKPGFHAVGCCVCSPDCPAGFADTGTGCTKPSYGRGVGKTVACGAGLEQSGLLCYPACNKPGFAGNGPVCWGKCPSQHPTDCGAGCATTSGQCAMAVGDQVVSPIMAVVAIVTFGEGAAAEQAARGAIAGGEEAAKSAEAVAHASKLKLAYQAVKNTMSQAKGGIEAAVGGPEKLKQLMTVVKVGSKVYRGTSATTKEIGLFQAEFASSFGLQTSSAIAEKVDASFGKKGALEVKKEWALRNLTLMLDADGFATAKNFVTILSLVDPSGLESVYNAYLHPICGDDAVFPVVHPIYPD